jgi:hypothetical protein
VDNQGMKIEFRIFNGERGTIEERIQKPKENIEGDQEKKRE